MSHWRVKYKYEGGGDREAWFVFEGTQTEFFTMLAEQFASEHPTLKMFEMKIDRSF